MRQRSHRKIIVIYAGHGSVGFRAGIATFASKDRTIGSVPEALRLMTSIAGSPTVLLKTVGIVWSSPAPRPSTKLPARKITRDTPADHSIEERHREIPRDREKQGLRCHPDPRSIQHSRDRGRQAGYTGPDMTARPLRLGGFLAHSRSLPLSCRVGWIHSLRSVTTGHRSGREALSNPSKTEFKLVVTGAPPEIDPACLYGSCLGPDWDRGDGQDTAHRRAEHWEASKRGERVGSGRKVQRPVAGSKTFDEFRIWWETKWVGACRRANRAVC